MKLRLTLVFVLALLGLGVLVASFFIYKEADSAMDLVILYFAAFTVELFCCFHLYQLIHGPIGSMISE